VPEQFDQDNGTKEKDSIGRRVGLVSCVCGRLRGANYVRAAALAVTGSSHAERQTARSQSGGKASADHGTVVARR
jgi:hypothetical protein